MHKLKNKCGNDSQIMWNRLFPTLPVFNKDKFYLDSSRV